MQLAEIFERAIGRDAPLEFRAFDGSRAGDPDAPTRVVVRSPLAMSHLASAPGELGLARAYVSGSLDIDGETVGSVNVGRSTPSPSFPRASSWPAPAPT